MSQQADKPGIPRAVIHRRILDAAAEEPDASMESLAEDIPSATTELVERVLEQYGDPADEEAPTEDELDLPMTEEAPPISLEELTEAQRRTLRAIHEQPTATQSDLADELGVSAATICNRVGDIPGFEWADREAFVDALFTNEDPMESQPESVTNGGDPEPPVARLESRLEAVEEELDGTPAEQPGGVFADPELLHKVIHACIESERISEEEELELLRAVLSAE